MARSRPKNNWKSPGRSRVRKDDPAVRDLPPKFNGSTKAMRNLSRTEREDVREAILKSRVPELSAYLALDGEVREKFEERIRTLLDWYWLEEDKQIAIPPSPAELIVELRQLGEAISCVVDRIEATSEPSRQAVFQVLAVLGTQERKSQTHNDPTSEQAAPSVFSVNGALLRELRKFRDVVLNAQKVVGDEVQTGPRRHEYIDLLVGQLINASNLHGSLGPTMNDTFDLNDDRPRSPCYQFLEEANVSLCLGLTEDALAYRVKEWFKRRPPD